MNDEAKILKVIADYLGLEFEDLDKQAFLRDDLNLGPIELNDLLSELSRKFNIEFDPAEVENLRKVEDILVLVEDNLIG